MSGTYQNPSTPPPQYFPLEDGVYHVRAGLRALGADPQENVPENRVFQLDSQYSLYRKNKDACRAESLEKYYCVDDDSDAVRREVALWMIGRLLLEHPGEFSLVQEKNGNVLACRLSGERIAYAPDGVLEGDTEFSDLFDAMCCQVQEDAAIVRMEGERDWIAALHLCAPNHWSAAEKLGKNFVDVHEPVADIDSVLKTAPQLVRGMIFKNPYVRFAWGLSSDQMLNHHPLLPPGRSPGRRFTDPGAGLFLRIERQTMNGFPSSKASLFTIRTYFRDCAGLTKDELGKLISAIDSMSAESRRYKGLLNEFDDVRAKLVTLAR